MSNKLRTVGYFVEGTNINLSNIFNIIHIGQSIEVHDELIIYGGISKNIKRYIDKYLGDYNNIRLQKKSFNKALENSSCSYVINANPNEILHVENVKECASFLARNKDVDIVVLCRARFVKKDTTFEIDYEHQFDYATSAALPTHSRVVDRRIRILKQAKPRDSVFYTGTTILPLHTNLINLFLFYALGKYYASRYKARSMQNLGVAWLEEQNKSNSKIFITRKEIQPKRKIIIGAGATYQHGFLSTDIGTLNIINSKDWEKLFETNSIDNLVAEHVFEHLSTDEIIASLKLCYQYLKPGGKLRIAVPDKNRDDQLYIDTVKPPADGHKSYLNLKDITNLLESAGFTVVPLEYFDEKGKFHAKKWSLTDGRIKRSTRYNKQRAFKRGKIYYTSLLVDAIKPI